MGYDSLTLGGFLNHYDSLGYIGSLSFRGSLTRLGFLDGLDSLSKVGFLVRDGNTGGACSADFLGGLLLCC